MVISYSYLWHFEHGQGRDEGRKNRPGVILLTIKREENLPPRVIVLPITHSEPRDPTGAVEIPPGVKQHLGLDGERSWIIVSEGNQFDWPGYDLRKIGNVDRYDYGVLPPRLFEKVREAFLNWHRIHKARLTSRA